jgi:hypothetical protein
MACSCEHGNELLGFIKDGAVFYYGRDNRLLLNLSVLSHLLRVVNCPCEWNRGFISYCITYLHRKSDNFKFRNLTIVLDNTYTHTHILALILSFGR